jgi:hypothetical protein
MAILDRNLNPINVVLCVVLVIGLTALSNQGLRRTPAAYIDFLRAEA